MLAATAVAARAADMARVGNDMVGAMFVVHRYRCGQSRVAAMIMIILILFEHNTSSMFSA